MRKRLGAGADNEIYWRFDYLWFMLLRGEGLLEGVVAWLSSGIRVKWFRLLYQIVWAYKIGYTGDKGVELGEVLYKTNINLRYYAC